MSNYIIWQSLQEMDRLDNDDGWGSPPYYALCRKIWSLMDGTTRDVMRQLMFLGPVEDGDVASKAARDNLLDWKLAVRVVHKGEQGFTAGTYRVFTICKENNIKK